MAEGAIFPENLFVVLEFDDTDEGEYWGSCEESNYNYVNTAT